MNYESRQFLTPNAKYILYLESEVRRLTQERDKAQKEFAEFVNKMHDDSMKQCGIMLSTFLNHELSK